MGCKTVWEFSGKITNNGIYEIIHCHLKQQYQHPVSMSLAKAQLYRLNLNSSGVFCTVRIKQSDAFKKYAY